MASCQSHRSPPNRLARQDRSIDTGHAPHPQCRQAAPFRSTIYTLRTHPPPPHCSPCTPLAAMASPSFRDSMQSLGWSRREQPAPTTTTTTKPTGVYGTLAKLNPFNSEGYVRLPVHENEEAPGAPLPARTRREEEEGWFARESCSFSFLGLVWVWFVLCVALGRGGEWKCH